jgi:hypothetical protein
VLTPGTQTRATLGDNPDSKAVSRLVGRFHSWTFTRCDDGHMFVERLTAPREEFELWDARLRMVTDPPPALALSVAWEENGEVTCINVWDAPEAIADFFIERVRPFVENEGAPANKPQRLGHAIRAYVRPSG